MAILIDLFLFYGRWFALFMAIVLALWTDIAYIVAQNLWAQFQLKRAKKRLWLGKTTGLLNGEEWIDKMPQTFFMTHNFKRLNDIVMSQAQAQIRKRKRQNA